MGVLGSFGMLRYCQTVQMNHNSDCPRGSAPPPHSSPVIVQGLYIGPDTIQSAQWHCMDKSVAQVKGTEVCGFHFGQCEA